MLSGRNILSLFDSSQEHSMVQTDPWNAERQVLSLQTLLGFHRGFRDSPLEILEAYSSEKNLHGYKITEHLINAPGN